MIKFERKTQFLRLSKIIYSDGQLDLKISAFINLNKLSVTLIISHQKDIAFEINSNNPI